MNQAEFNLLIDRGFTGFRVHTTTLIKEPKLYGHLMGTCGCILTEWSTGFCENLDKVYDRLLEIASKYNQGPKRCADHTPRNSTKIAKKVQVIDEYDISDEEYEKLMQAYAKRKEVR